MKYIKILTLILALNSAISAQDCIANLTIKTNQERAVIFLNDSLLGRGHASIELEPGNYFIEIYPGVKIWNMPVIKDSIQIEECVDLNKFYSLDDLVYLATDPADAAVYFLDTLIGHTPLFISTKENFITLKKNDFASKMLAVSELQPNETVKLEFTGYEKGASFFETNLYRILLSGIVILGGTTAYFKLKADKYHDDYQTTGEEFYLNRTRRFDLISGITMGMLQINFGYLIYRFLE
jgi:hypothetical protein